MARILIVDDSSTALEMTRALLAGTRHEILTAQSWGAALVSLQQRDVDLMLLDVDMPGVTGDALLTMVRRVLEPVPAVIFHSALPASALRRLTRRVGGQGFLEKGHDAARLITVVDAALEGRERRLSDSSPSPPCPGEAELELAEEGAAPGGWLPRLLIVDDSMTRRLRLSDFFLTLGHPVETARDGWDALARLAAQTPQTRTEIILSDVNMPRVDGFELTRRVRADPRYARIPVMLFSTSRASLEAESDAQALEAGASEYLRGAVDVSELPEHVAARVETMREIRALEAARAAAGEVGPSLAPATAEAPPSHSSPGRRASIPRRRSREPGPQTTQGGDQDLQASVQELELLERLTRERSGDPNVMEWLAFRLFVHERLDEAGKLYEELIARDHRTGVQFFHLGNVLARQGRSEEALGAWRRSLERRPSSHLARRVREAIAAETAAEA